MSLRARDVPMPSLSSATGWVLGTGSGLGLFPVAPATAASLAAVLVYGFSPLPKTPTGCSSSSARVFSSEYGPWAPW